MNRSEKHRSLSQWVARGAFWSVLCNGLAGPLNLLAIGYALAHLGAEHYGVYALIVVFGTYLRIGDLGLSLAFSRLTAEQLARGQFASLARSLRSVTTMLALSGGAIGGFAWLLRNPILFGLCRIPPVYRSEAYACFGLILLATLIVLLSPTFASLVVGAQRTDLSQKVAGSVKILNAAGIVLALRWNLGVTGMAAAMLAANAVGLIAYITIARRIVPQVPLRLFGGIDWIVATSLLRYGMGLQLLQIAIPLINQVDRLFIAHYISLALAGKYDVALKVVYAVSGGLYLLPFPLYAAAAAMNAQGRWEEMRRWVKRSARLFIPLAVPVFAMLCVASSSIARVWLGHTEPQIAGAVALFSLIECANCVIVPGYYIMMGAGRLRPILIGALGCAAFGIVFALCVVRPFGYWGVVTASALAELALIAWYAMCIRRLFGLSLWGQFRHVPVPFSIGALNGLLFGIVVRYLSPSRPALLILIALFSLPGVIVLWRIPYLDPEDRRTVYHLLRWDWARKIADRLGGRREEWD